MIADIPLSFLQLLEKKKGGWFSEKVLLCFETKIVFLMYIKVYFGALDAST